MKSQPSVVPVERCPACGGAGGNLAARRQDGRYLRKCGECTALYVTERPGDILAYYQEDYFQERLGAAESAGIGYATGYPPLVEQAWQVGAALALAGLSGVQTRRILDVGSALGHFLSYCRSFGWEHVSGVEPAEEVAAACRARGFDVAPCSIEAFQTEHRFDTVTAWDVMEHLADPTAFVSKLAGLLDPDGIFVFSTPDGDAPSALSDPDRWKGFATSFEHLVYFTSASLRKLLAPAFAAVFVFPFKLFGFDFLLGLASRRPLPAGRAALAAGLFDDVETIVRAGDRRELPASALAGLAMAMVQFGRSGEAMRLIAWLEENVGDLPDPAWLHFAAGVAAHQARLPEAARQGFERAAGSALLRDLALHCAVESIDVAWREYRNDKELYIAGLLADREVLRETAAALSGREEALRAELERVQYDHALAERGWEERLAGAERRLRDLEREFAAYSSDKEKYIASLLGRLRSVAWAESLVSLPARTVTGVCRLVRKAVWKAVRLVMPRKWRAIIDEARRCSLDLAPLKVDVFPAGSAARLGGRRRVAVSLITTVRNEASSLRGWWETVLRQQRLPDEVVIVDAGSTDGTHEILREISATAPFPVRWRIVEGASIAAGRNAAICEAHHAVIACTDLGCHLDPAWLAEIVVPFEADPAIEVVAGQSLPYARTPFEVALGALTVSLPEAIDPATYLPSSRTLAFRKEAWQQAGAYPEWLTFAGEDTLFTMHLRKTSPRWAYAPGAVVYWHMRPTLTSAARQAYFYGLGDGEAALFPDRYFRDAKALAAGVTGLICVAAAATGVALGAWGGLAAGYGVAAGCAAVAAGLLRTSWKHLAHYLPGRAQARSAGAERIDPHAGPGLALPLLLTILVSRCCGFLQGVRNRPEIARRRHAAAEGTCVVFSGVPIHDSGGGQRAAQLALEWLDRGYRVVFLNEYPTYESVDLHIEIFHPNLETRERRNFDAAAILAGHPSGRPLVAIAEFPHPAFLEPLRQLKRAGAKVVYDLIDDWRSSLGGDWYTEATERDVVALSDVLVASARDLVERLESESGRPVVFVPNAVNTRLFRPGVYSPPPDLPDGKPTFVYIGALWGEWFDWDLLIAVADEFTEGQVIVIGDYRGQSPENRTNLHFLGLKPQRDLPAYLAHADAAMIPFKLSRLTQAVSPLKVFEYLAMGVPVVATPMRELRELPYVFTGESKEAFVAAARKACNTRPDPAMIARFIARNSWSERVNSIMDALNGGSHQGEGFPPD